MLTARHDVPGEDLPFALPTALLVVAVALGAVFVREVAARGPSIAPPIQTTATPVTTLAVVEQPAREAMAAPAPDASAPAAPAAPPASAPSPVAPTAKCPAILVDFRSGEASASDGVMREMRRLGEQIAAVPGASVVVDGHADSLGSDDLNLRLSKRRAEALAWSLERGGLTHDRITSRGFGAFTPIEGSALDADENRRAVIHVRGMCPEGFSEVLGP